MTEWHVFLCANNCLSRAQIIFQISITWLIFYINISMGNLSIATQYLTSLQNWFLGGGARIAPPAIHRISSPSQVWLTRCQSISHFWLVNICIIIDNYVNNAFIIWWIVRWYCCYRDYFNYGTNFRKFVQYYNADI